MQECPEYWFDTLCGHVKKVVDILHMECLLSGKLAKVDENKKPIPGTEEFYSCDTLLLSCGLIPEKMKLNGSLKGYNL